VAVSDCLALGDAARDSALVAEEVEVLEELVLPVEVFVAVAVLVRRAEEEADLESV